MPQDLPAYHGGPVAVLYMIQTGFVKKNLSLKTKDLPLGRLHRPAFSGGSAFIGSEADLDVSLFSAPELNIVDKRTVATGQAVIVLRPDPPAPSVLKCHDVLVCYSDALSH